MLRTIAGMVLKFRLSLVLAALICAASPVVAQPAPDPDPVASAWALDGSDLTPDPAIRLGVLPNGMRYALRANDTPRDTIAVRMMIDAGSLDEADNEQGVAHFLEHMAFNGSKAVPEGAMIPLLERLGLAFGADTNAYTSFDRTVYKLDLPRKDAELLDTALMLMRETASELLIDPQAVERERGVVIAEHRERNNYQRGNQMDQMAFFAAGTRYPDRFPVGSMEVLKSVSADVIRGFYQRHYRPDTTVLVIVGALDVDAAEAAIKTRFGDWRAPATPRPARDVGQLMQDRGLQIDSYVHPSLAESADIVAPGPWRDVPDTVAERKRSVARQLGVSMINRRLQRLARSADAPFATASFGPWTLEDAARGSYLSVTSADKALERALPAAAMEIRSALELGFSQEELAEQLANFDLSLRNAVAGAATRGNASLADSLLDMAKTGQIITTPQQSLSRFEAARPDFTPIMVQTILREDLPLLTAPLIRMTGRDAANLPTSSAIDALWREVSARPAVASASIPTGGFAYTDFGPPGNILADGMIADLGIRTIRFANNVRLNLKRTDLDASTVHVSVKIDGGAMLASKDDPQALAMLNFFTAGGLEKHSIDDLQSLLAGTSVGASLEDGTDHFAADATIAPKDLALQMQVLAAFVTAPGYRIEGEQRFRKAIPNFYAQLYATPGAALSAEIGGILSNNDPRFSFPERAILEAQSFERLRAVISDRLAKGAIEIAIVGDFDEDAAIKAVARTFGALPLREAEFRAYAEQRQRSFTGNLAPRIIRHNGPDDQAMLLQFWPTSDDSDLKRDLGMRLLAEILRLQLLEELRETLGATYAPSAASDMSINYPGYGVLRLASSAEPGQIETVTAAVNRITKGLRDAPVSEDLLERARRPLAERFANAPKGNGYWLALASRAQSRPERLDRARQAQNVLAAVTPADVQALARHYLVDAARLDVQVLPREVSSTETLGLAPAR